MSGPVDLLSKEPPIKHVLCRGTYLADLTAILNNINLLTTLLVFVFNGFKTSGKQLLLT